MILMPGVAVALAAILTAVAFTAGSLATYMIFPRREQPAKKPTPQPAEPDQLATLTREMEAVR